VHIWKTSASIRLTSHERVLTFFRLGLPLRFLGVRDFAEVRDIPLLPWAMRDRFRGL